MGEFILKLIKQYDAVFFLIILGKSIPVGELYFDMSKLHTHLESVGKVGKQGAKKLQRYVKYPIFACKRVFFC